MSKHFHIPEQVKRLAKENEGNTKVQTEIKIEYVPIDDLQPNDYNPNRQSEEEFELLVRSIIDDGCTITIVVNKDTNVIVDGEHRWRACAVLGYHHVPVVYVDFTESQKRNATLRYNRARGKEDRRVAAEVEQAVEDTKIRK